MNWLQRPVAAAFVRRLRQAPRFRRVDLAALSGLGVEVRGVEANAAIVPEGPRGANLHVVLDGWAARCKMLENGARQIPALLLPGDICDLDALHLDRLNWATLAVTRCTVAAVPREGLLTLMDRYPGLREGVYRIAAVENALGTEWTVCLGRRSARERLAHLLCELLARLQAVRAAGDSGFTLPLTQEEIADVLGLTAVHVNRMLQTLRGEGLVQLRGRRLHVPDTEALRRLAGFDGRYLHLPSEGRVAQRSAGEASPDYVAA